MLIWYVVFDSVEGTYDMMSLRETRRRNLFSILQLAGKAGISTRTIVDIEHGRTVPRLQTIRKISEALEVSPDSVEEFHAALSEDPYETGKLAAA